MQTHVAPFDNDSIAKAAAIIKSGGCVVVPTETVYGLAADATSGSAVAGIYAAKGRPSFNPLIVHVASLEIAQAIGDFSETAQALAAAHWPGPLTIVVPLKPGSGIASITTAGLDTVALRVPNHSAMQALLAATGTPLAAPSANASGTISPTRSEHVRRTLNGKIPMIIDDGPTSGGIESTIIMVEGDRLRMLRAGPVMIENAVIAPTTGTVEAPGQLAAHYAPSKPLRLNALNAEPDEWMVGFGPIAGDATLSANGDLIEAASRLFDLLHQADQSVATRIAVAPIPDTGIGVAINDRLCRAAVGAA